MAEVLRIEDLHVSFDTYAGEVRSVRGVSFHVNEGEVLAVVGESVCHYEAQSHASSTDQASDYFALRNRYRCLLRKRDAGNTGTDGQYDFPRSHDLHESYQEGGQTNNGNLA